MSEREERKNKRDDVTRRRNISFFLFLSKTYEMRNKRSLIMMFVIERS